MNEVNRGLRGSTQRVTFGTEIRPDPENYSKICSLVFKHDHVTLLAFGSMTAATTLKLREIRVIGNESPVYRKGEELHKEAPIVALLSAHAKTLESVALCGNDAVNRHVTNEFLLSSWPALRKVRFDALRIRSLTEFFQGHVNLESVNRESHLLTAEELETLSSSCTRLRSLQAGVTPWSSSVIPLAKCRFLEHLHITFTSGTLAGLQEIATGCPHLKTLDVTQPRGLPSSEVLEGIAEIANKCPDLQVVKYGKRPSNSDFTNQYLGLNEREDPALYALASQHPNCMIHTNDHPNGILGKDAYALFPSLFDRIWGIFVEIYKLVCCLFCCAYPG